LYQAEKSSLCGVTPRSSRATRPGYDRAGRAGESFTARRETSRASESAQNLKDAFALDR